MRRKSAVSFRNHDRQRSRRSVSASTADPESLEHCRCVGAPAMTLASAEASRAGPWSGGTTRWIRAFDLPHLPPSAPIPGDESTLWWRLRSPLALGCAWGCFQVAGYSAADRGHGAVSMLRAQVWRGWAPHAPILIRRLQASLLQSPDRLPHGRRPVTPPALQPRRNSNIRLSLRLTSGEKAALNGHGAGLMAAVHAIAGSSRRILRRDLKLLISYSPEAHHAAA